MCYWNSYHNFLDSKLSHFGRGYHNYFIWPPLVLGGPGVVVRRWRRMGGRNALVGTGQISGTFYVPLPKNTTCSTIKTIEYSGSNGYWSFPIHLGMPLRCYLNLAPSRIIAVDYPRFMPRRKKKKIPHLRVLSKPHALSFYFRVLKNHYFFDQLHLEDRRSQGVYLGQNCRIFNPRRLVCLSKLNTLHLIYVIVKTARDKSLIINLALEGAFYFLYAPPCNGYLVAHLMRPLASLEKPLFLTLT